uniref:Uncharacterized protein n=1 Tax=Anguilla anguilla TaxID=7936 RepID=A0A0E9U1U2_ANGAN
MSSRRLQAADCSQADCLSFSSLWNCRTQQSAVPLMETVLTVVHLSFLLPLISITSFFDLL